MLPDEYRTISSPAEGIFKDRGSKFHSFIYPVSDLEVIKSLIHQNKKITHECNQHCYAFRLGPDGSTFRCSDDREPSGSAGKPILGQLLSNDLTDNLIIVARYFGGSLLGVPGLINAYRSAANDAINNSKIIIKTDNESYQLTITYEYLNELMNILKSEPVVISQQEYNEPVVLNISIRKSRKNALLEKLNSNHLLASRLVIK